MRRVVRALTALVGSRARWYLPNVRVPILTLVTLIASAAVSEREASAREIPSFAIAVGAGGAGSTWSGDSVVASNLKIAFQFERYFSIFFLGRLGYGNVDQRLLTLVSAGGQFALSFGKVRPYVRLALAHIHEESVVNVGWGALFGIGDGVRHRGGFEGALGAEIPIVDQEKFELTAAAELWSDWLVQGEGPSVYVGGTLLLGIAFDV